MSGGPYTAHSQNGAVRPFVRFSILFFTTYTETAQTYLIFHIYTLLYSNLFSALLNSHLSSAQNCSLLCSTLISSLLCSSPACCAVWPCALCCGPLLLLQPELVVFLRCAAKISHAMQLLAVVVAAAALASPANGFFVGSSRGTRNGEFALPRILW